MSPIEVLWIALTISFGFVGAARGYPRELGATTVILVDILILERFGRPAVTFFDSEVGTALGIRILQHPNSDLVQFLIYSTFFLLIVFAAYAGETFAFPGKPTRGRTGSLLSIANGLINGYLITGTVWYYLDKYNYPLQRWGLFRPPLTPLAQELLKYVPPRILDPTTLLGLVAILLLLRVRR